MGDRRTNLQYLLGDFVTTSGAACSALGPCRNVAGPAIGASRVAVALHSELLA